MNLAKKDLNVFDARTVQRYLDALKNKESFKSFGDGIVDVSARLDDFNIKVSDDLVKVLDNEELRGSFTDLSKTIDKLRFFLVPFSGLLFSSISCSNA